MQFFIKGIRSIFAWLDIIVYGAIEIIYNLFTEIAQTNIFSSRIIEKFGMRIYALLGIIMLFKLSFSLINYMINPSQMNDKSKGGGKLVTNILIVLLLIVTTPFLFEVAFDLQHIILSENTVGKIILGAGGSEGLNVRAQERAGRIMSFDVFLAFYKPDSTIIDCQEDYLVKDEFNRIVLTEACRNALDGIDESIRAGQVYDKAVKNSSIKILTESKLLHLTKPGSDTFAFDYNAVLSTIAGGFVAWILLMFCIDIAVRSVKLGFYQLIAPIPIISYIDPDSSKNGFFQKWLKNTTSTFLDVFIRLAAIYFVIFIISNLDQMEVWKDRTMQPQTDLFVRVFVILGALLFAKQLPQILQDLTGMKLDGGFSLNPVRKMGSVPLVGGLAAAGLTMAGAGAIGGFKALGGLTKAAGKGITSGEGAFSEQLAKTKNDFSRRMNISSDVARQRMSSAGLLGTDKLSGDSPGRIYASERSERRKAATEGRKSNLELDVMSRKGQNLYEQLEARKREDNTVKDSSIFKSGEYRKSYDDVEKAKGIMYKARNAAAVAQSNYAAAASRGNEEEMKHYQQEYEKFTKAAGSAEARHNYLKSRHENIKKQFQKDAEREDALNAYKKIAQEVEIPESKPFVSKNELNIQESPNEQQLDIFDEIDKL